ncbi:DUF3369 domain-containing protein [Idiomarina sp. Sol25]|uniref:DUF3369 domain-containing protein n=1 Tax=Idiomarina sp. Sol25 TaxID=3064000 RepID=UPI00294AD627|nr:DUF3369 domain-containing protein [Idiomarina sp. Sol25]MDV6326581.1 DUF3369 domain-containing protein [Idiomarina sp. Sol25]
MSNQFMFADEGSQQTTKLPTEYWKILIVDDEPEVHAVTKLALNDFNFLGRGLKFYSAFSGEEAKQLIDEHPDAAILLLDVVMETDDAGLQVARYIREEADNHFTRIILRTGQPGQAPERTVIVNYDINDYKSKTELTAQKLFTAVMSSLRSYRDIMSIDQSRHGLEKIIAASANLYALQPMNSFVDGLVQQLSWVIGGAKQTLYATSNEDGSSYKVLAAHGEDSGVCVGQTLRSVIPSKALAELEHVIANHGSYYGDDFVLLYCRSHCRSHGSVLFIGGLSRALTADDHHVLQLFSENVQLAQDNVVCLEDSDKFLARLADQLMLHHASHFNGILEQNSEVRLAYAVAQKVAAEDAETTALAWSLFAQARPLLNCASDAAAAVETTCQQRVARSLRALGHGEHEATQSAHRALIERLERWDGLGLPEGKQGSDIAISTQVLLLTEQLLDWWESGISDSDIAVRLKDERGRYYSPKFLDVVIKSLPELRTI